MDKLVYSGTVLIALALIAGSIFIPDSFVMTLASVSTGAIIARSVLVVLMVVLVITNPPRQRAVRAILAVTSVTFLWWSLTNTLNGTIHLADSILYLEAAVAFGIEALESGVKRQPIFGDAKAKAVLRGINA